MYYRNEFIDCKVKKLGNKYIVEVLKKGEFVCEASGPTKKVAKERACYKACELLGFV